MKILVGRIIAGLFCIVGIPVHLCIAILIKILSPGPVLFRSPRLGLNGAVFSLLKYRTMRVNSPPVVTLGFKTVVQKADARVTWIGKWLRCGIDELPQVWNIVCGEMAWIGPRPDEDWMLVNYGPVSRGRISVFPGITGFAQVLDSRNLTTAEGYALDVWYIAHRSVWLDTWIAIVTPLFMAGWRSIGRPRLKQLVQTPEFQNLWKSCEAELAARSEMQEKGKADAAIFSAMS